MSATRSNGDKEILDAEGKPLFHGRLRRRKGADNGFRIYEDEQGQKYWLNEGVRDYVLPYVTVGRRKENGRFETTYDSRRDPPLLAKE